MNLKIDYVSVFAGEGEIPADEDSENIWKLIDPNIVVKKFGRADNFWGPTGNEGPCGPTSEIYVNGLEVWNLVFNEYFQNSDGKLEKLKTQGIDTGMGLERLTMVTQGKESVFETELFDSLMALVPSEAPKNIQRIIAEHIRAAAFLISDGVIPSNKDQGYVLRKILRRQIRYSHSLTMKNDYTKALSVIDKQYGEFYPSIKENKESIILELEKEFSKFIKTLESGLRVIKGLFEKEGDLNTFALNDSTLFDLYQSYGFPVELSLEEINRERKNRGLLSMDSTLMNMYLKMFQELLKKHQEQSRAGAEKKFGGHGIVSGDISGADKAEIEKKTRLHTATHVVVAALEKVLGQKLPQAGSDISVERLRFDFAFPRKVTPEEIKQAQDIANEIVAKDLPVTFEEMDIDKAFESGASGAFKHKYGSRVKVYSIGPAPSNPSGPPFSRELCGGPHVTHTGEIGHITITKEESVSGGNRRIRAIIE